MEEMRGAAMAYFARMSDDQRQSLEKFKSLMDRNGDGKVSSQEYLDFIRKQGYDHVPSNLFRLLDGNNRGYLDFEECVTVFYMITCNRFVFCGGYNCKSHLLGLHFVCVECYKVGKGTFSLCSSCYRDTNFGHEHSTFLDNYDLLRTKPWELQSQTNRETEGIFEAAKAHYAALSGSGKLEVRNRFKTMDSDGDGAVSSRGYSDYLTKAGYSDDRLFNLFDQNGDGKLDFDEFITSDFIHTMGGRNRCGGCSVTLLGIYFVCIKCYDAGKTYSLCCKCYGDKSYKHLNDHTYFIDTYSLIDIKRPKPASATQTTMEDLVNTARLYYDKSSSDIKRAAVDFFISLDRDSNGKVSLHEFLGITRQQGHVKMSSRNFFKKLDKDGRGALEFMEVMALYYIIKSGRPFCGGCDDFILGMYFTCSICFDNGNDLFCVCPNCFQGDHFVHEHNTFLDNYALLEAKRMQRIATFSNQHKPNSSVTVTELPTSTRNAVVPYGSKPRAWDLKFKALSAALNTTVANVCTIM